MKIFDLFETEVDEARRGNYGREQSKVAGQQIGKDISNGALQGDTTAAIQTAQQNQQAANSQGDLKARLAAKQAAKQPAAGATGGAGAFGNMSANLSATPPPAASGVQRYTARPNNPNEPKSVPSTDTTAAQPPAAASGSPDPVRSATPLPGAAADAAQPKQSVWDKTKAIGNKAAGVAGDISAGIQKTAQGTGNLVKGVGNAVNTAAQGVGNAASGIANAVASPVGAFKQGLRGGGVAGVGGQAGGGSDKQIAAMNTRLANIEKTLGIAESYIEGTYRVESKYLGMMI